MGGVKFIRYVNRKFTTGLKMTTVSQWHFVLNNFEHANAFDECPDNWIERIYKYLTKDEINIIEKDVSMIIGETYNKTMTFCNGIFVLCFKNALPTKRVIEILGVSLTQSEKSWLYTKTKNYVALYGENPFM